MVDTFGYTVIEAFVMKSTRTVAGVAYLTAG